MLVVGCRFFTCLFLTSGFKVLLVMPTEFVYIVASLNFTKCFRVIM